MNRTTVTMRVRSLLSALGFPVSAGKQTNLTKEQWPTVLAAYQDQFGSSLLDDITSAENSGDEGDGEEEGEGNSEGANAQGPTISQEQLNQLHATLSSAFAPIDGEQTPGSNPAVPTEGENNGAAPAAPQGTVTLESLQTLANGFVQSMRAAAPDLPVATANVSTMNINGPGTTATHLFGIENEYFNLKRRWNQIAKTPSVANTSVASDEDESAFNTEFRSYGAYVRNRYAFLHENNMLDADRLATGEFATNEIGFSESGIPEQYLVRRADALIARVLKKRVTPFPVRYGVQDKEVMLGAFFDSYSQSYQEGDVSKGGMEIQPEIAYVDDAMIKVSFGSYKKLERRYYGYLNKSGSDPIKWTMIEFALLGILETAQVEQNKRRMLGIFIAPTKDMPGHFMNAGTGFFSTLVRYYHENKMMLHDEADYRTYTEANMLEVIKAFAAEVAMSIVDEQDLDGHTLYLNAAHKGWYIENVRAKYGQNTDFTGPDSYLHVLPDTEIRIEWLSYMKNIPVMFMDVPGNFQHVEFLPGEMYSVKMQQFLEKVWGMSYWKEGSSAEFVGKKFGSLDTLKENKFQHQVCFMNKPSVTAAVDATTLDATKGFWFETSSNTVDKVLTNITAAKAGVAYIIECAGTEHPTTITKGDDKWTITADYTPTKVGDYIMVALDPTGKFVELERCVNGVRKINAAVQPNVPGANS